MKVLEGDSCCVESAFHILNSEKLNSQAMQQQKGATQDLQKTENSTCDKKEIQDITPSKMQKETLSERRKPFKTSMQSHW